MRLGRSTVVAAFAALSACTDPPAPLSPDHPGAARLKEAHGRVTTIDAHNAPEVLTVPPERTVKAGPFEPITEQSEATRAIAHTRTWTTDDGLPMDDITCGYLDANGMLWFGTNGGGISRYDGRSFTNFTMAHGLPDNTILSLGGDRQGNIWIGTSTGGLCRFDGHSFTTFSIGEGTGHSKENSCMEENTKDLLWLGTNGHGM